MERIFRRAIGAAAMIMVFGSCGEEDLIFPGGTAGPAVAIDLTISLFELRAGETLTIGMQGRDEAGNPVSASTPTIASSDAAVVTAAAGAGNDNWAATATVTATGLGETTMTVTLGSLTEILTVRVGPGSMLINDPAAGVIAVLPSGTAIDFDPSTTYTFPLAMTDINGSAVTGDGGFVWTTTDDDLIEMNQETGEFTTVAPGSAEIQVRASGGASAVKTLILAPSLLNGTASATSGPPGGLVTLTRDPAADAFDGDTEVDFNFGAQPAWIESQTADELVVAVPATGLTGRVDMVLSDFGANDLLRRVEFSSTSAFDDLYAIAGNVTNDCSIPASVPDLMAIRSANNNVYLSHGGFGTGSASRGCQNGGGQIDHYFTLTAGGSDLDVDLLLEWGNGSDVDIIVCSDPVTFTCAFTFFSGSDEDEDGSGVTIPAGETWYVVVTMWSAGSDITNMRLGVN